MRLEARICRMSHMTKTVTTREGAYGTHQNLQHAPSTHQGTQIGAVEIFEDKRWNEEED